MTVAFSEFMADAPEPNEALRRAFQRRKELTASRHLNASVLQSKFRPGVCCEHEWWDCTEGGQVCITCKARCVRDRDGQIVEYTAGTP